MMLKHPEYAEGHTAKMRHEQGGERAVVSFLGMIRVRG